MSFLVVRQSMATVQCVVTVTEDLVSEQMLKYANSLSRESIVNVEGVVTVPLEFIEGTTQKVEIQVRKLNCVNRAASNLPVSVEELSMSEEEIKEAEKTGEKNVRVNQDILLNRVLSLRTPANQAIFRLKCFVQQTFINFLLSEGFIEIHTPRFIDGASEGGQPVAKLGFDGQTVYFGQSPQLHKQIVVCADVAPGVFEIGPVLKPEVSYSRIHMFEFTGLDVEMMIYEHYFEYLPETLRLTFEEGVSMLKDAGIEVDPFGDLNTEAEMTLGRLVLEKYKTEFYILHRYPLAVRHFYTMPCPDNPLYSNSFNVFIRGVEIISGAQKMHSLDLLTSQAKARGVDASTISAYVNSFQYGACPHGGFRAGLERVVMLFCGLSNIRQTSMFPQDS